MMDVVYNWGNDFENRHFEFAMQLGDRGGRFDCGRNICNIFTGIVGIWNIFKGIRYLLYKWQTENLSVCL